MTAHTDGIGDAIYKRLTQKKIDALIRSRWTNKADKTRRAAFHETKATPDQPLPYLIYEQSQPTPTGNSAGADSANDDQQYFELLLNFRAIGSTRAQAKEIKHAVIEAIEGKTDPQTGRTDAGRLVVTDGSQATTMIRSSDSLLKDPQTDSEWHGVVTYTLRGEMTFNNKAWRAT